MMMSLLWVLLKRSERGEDRRQVKVKEGRREDGGEGGKVRAESS